MQGLTTRQIVIAAMIATAFTLPFVVLAVSVAVSWKG